ncbi:EAL domain, c-di-GMP-specific phosphodiesterase class I (or its enzymatically inactive variant) [Salisediminibacterium halotolerans]|uniref:EAL domain, c-di-GMP-specific phosphodiesterase class I (Or its enzymatically inactive variant) n=2 Tax=Salisediminibacterium halotolerans TaxID=517425 RepID=A0A1H9VG08_9BACI|nr:EAL domain, c-di-GMP-specific phosphodiesterase class I (or its enzymatically inactive variant) [Salisediminibacterium haloalkalitolerans]
MIRANRKLERKSIEEIFMDVENKTYNVERDALFVPYGSLEQLHTFVTRLTGSLTGGQIEETEGNVIGTEDQNSSVYPVYPIKEMALRIDHPLYTEIIQNRLFQSFMQPIVSAADTNVYGYEFLLRPNSDDYPFSPGELFQFSTRAGMQSMLDSQARVSAIQKASEELDDEKAVFINFLPSTIYSPSFCLRTTFEAVKKYAVKPENLIFEVVETEKIADFSHLEAIFAEYRRHGVKVALDDIGSGYATVDVLKKLTPHFAKIDRELIRDCHLSPLKQSKIKHIAKTAEEIGTKVLAEGIETEEEFSAVKGYVDLAQGYYFGKPAAKPASVEN